MGEPSSGSSHLEWLKHKCSATHDESGLIITPAREENVDRLKTTQVGIGSALIPFLNRAFSWLDHKHPNDNNPMNYVVVARRPVRP